MKPPPTIAGATELPVNSTVDLAHAEHHRAELEKTWRRPPGFLGWVASVNHKDIGMRFIVTAFVFLALGGIEAALMRWQLSRPESGFLGPDLYNQVFTVHGTTMMFLFAVPVMEGMGLWLIPLMLGTRSMAFPRLNAYSYWVYLIGGLLLYSGFLLNVGPDTGWFSYVPLAGPEFSPGKRVDVWAQMVTFTELAGLGGAVNMFVTILKHRAPGMSLDRMPLYIWSMLVVAVMIIFAMPAVMLASGALALDRLIGTHFFNPAEGGDALLWQHLFWFFGHPEVYIIFLPATGFISTLIGVFSRRQVVGYLAVVLSLVTTGFVGFGLWVHHMFATGLPQLGASFFTAASILIAIPSGVQVFCWIATLWTGRIQFTVPLLYALSFVVLFVLGGLSGVMLASVPLDLQVHDTYFVVAHFHYVLIGGAVFPLLGAVYFWFPKMTGRRLNDRLGFVALALQFAGFNLTFFPMHQLGILGMPRRVYTYLAARGWEGLNLLATIGAAVLAAGFLLYFVNLLWSRRRGALAGEDPWGADTLEWGTSSPPPPHNYDFLPTVRARYPLWTRAEDQPVVTGLATDKPEILVTKALDGDPDHRTHVADHSAAPLWMAVGTGVTFIGSIFTPWAALAGGALAALAGIFWFWPKAHEKKEPIEERP